MALPTPPNEDNPIQEVAQKLASVTLDNGLFVNFVGSVGSGDQQKALDFFNQVLDIGINFKSQPQVRHKQVENPTTQSFGSMPENGMSCEQLLECFRDIAQHSTNFASPKFMGFPDAANSIPALGAAMLVPFVNQNMCNQDIQAPMASFIEMEVVHWLRQQLGFQVPAEYATVTEIGGTSTFAPVSRLVANMSKRHHDRRRLSF
jgi:L-2,4-diaminobutyrate decarboxylase